MTEGRAARIVVAKIDSLTERGGQTAEPCTRLCLDYSVGPQLIYFQIAVSQLAENLTGALPQQRRGPHFHRALRKHDRAPYRLEAAALWMLHLDDYAARRQRLVF